MKTLLSVVFGFVAVAALGCTSSVEKQKQALESPVAVKAKRDDRADFAAYKTWSWVKLQAGAQIDSRLDDPEIKEMVREALDKVMFEHGYQRVEMSESPDLILNLHVTLNDVDHDYIQQHYDGEYYPEYRIEIGGEKLPAEWTEGAMLIILFDSKTGQAVWGAGAQTEVFPDLAPDVRRQRIEKIARLLMESLPRRS